jgi:hypothetical protein
MSRITYMQSWKSHRLTHIHGWALIYKLGDLSPGLSCHWFIFFKVEANEKAKRAFEDSI